MSQRTESLKSPFNEFMNEVVGTKEEDYYSRLTVNHFVRLKKVFANINNIITLQVTLTFVDMLKKAGIVDESQHAKIYQDIEDVNANANGYDVCYTGKVGSADGIIAEIKCNIPVGNKQFGAAQFKGIEKDVDGLMNGKTKETEINPKNYLKFMVLLDDGAKVNEAMKNFADKMNGKRKPIVILDKLLLTSLNINTIYVVICKLE